MDAMTNGTVVSDGTQVLLDPTGERSPQIRARLPRPASLAGMRIGILDLSKARGDVFLDRLAELLVARGLRVDRFRKPTYTKPAPPDLRYELSVKCDVVIEGLAD
jgi:hypothetical protein